jgi:hypothetical protein
MPLTLDTLRAVIRGPARPAVGQRGISKWMYVTDDAHATVTGAGYFNGAADRLTVGDQIDASTGMSGTPAGRHYIVTANAGGVVTVAQFLDT